MGLLVLVTVIPTLEMREICKNDCSAQGPTELRKTEVKA